MPCQFFRPIYYPHEVVYRQTGSPNCSKGRFAATISTKCFWISRRRPSFAVDEIKFLAGIVMMDRYLVSSLLIGIIVGMAPEGSAIADSDFDLHGGRPVTVQPNSPPGARPEMGHSHHIHDFQHHPVVGVPLLFFDNELLELEPEIRFVNPPSPPPPSLPVQQPCLPNPGEQTFTTEMTNGVRIIRGHSDRC